MTLTELTTYLTPAEVGIVAALVDETKGLGDDDAFYHLSNEFFNSADLDLDPSAAERFAYNVVHECKRNW